MLTLDNIKEKVYFEYRRAQMEAMKTERLGVIHVSDIIKPCMRNVIYNKTMSHTMSTEDMKSLYLIRVLLVRRLHGLGPVFSLLYCLGTIKTL